MNASTETVGKTTINNLQGQIMEARKEKAINAIKNSTSSLTLYYDENLNVRVCAAFDDGDIGTMFNFLEYMAAMVRTATEDVSTYIPQI
jgi:hypothetical protein